MPITTSMQFYIIEQSSMKMTVGTEVGQKLEEKINITKLHLMCIKSNYFLWIVKPKDSWSSRTQVKSYTSQVVHNFHP